MNLYKSIEKIIPINLLLCALALVYFYNNNNVIPKSVFLSETILITFLMLISTLYFLSNHFRKTDIYFFYLITNTTWILLLLLGEDLIFIRLSRVLMGIAPILLYLFFAYFSALHRSPFFTKYLYLISLSAFLTVCTLQTLLPILNYSFYVLLLITIICILKLSKNSNAQHRGYHKKYQKKILLSIFIGFIPFILANSFSPWIKSSSLIQLSHHSMVIFPITIGYILLRRSELNYEVDFKIIFYKCLVHVTSSCAFLAVLFFGFDLSLTTCIIILLIVNVGLFINSYFRKAIDAQYLGQLHFSKENFEKERLDILQKITYDNYLDSLTELIVNLIHNTIPTKDLLLIWSDEDKPFILHQSGVFSSIALNVDLQKSIYSEEFNIDIHSKSYFSFPLIYENKICGRITLGEKSSHSPYSEIELDQIKQLSDTISEILKTTEILNLNQRRYMQLPQSSFEDQINYHLVLKTDEIRKNLSLFLHDEILQTILALKNLIEVIPTHENELKSYILSQISNLNGIIRNQMFELYPSTLADLSLTQSISALCNSFIDHPKAPSISYCFEEEIDIPLNLKFPVFRMTKELIQNAIKHSRATHLNIQVSYEAKQELLYVSVMDNGIGIDRHLTNSNLSSNHFGLLSLRQEINMLKGEMNIIKTSSIGSHIQLKIPVYDYLGGPI